MSETVQIALIAGAAPTLIALATLIQSLKNSKKIDEVHALADGMKTELVKEVRTASLAKGHKEGVEEEQSRASGVNS